MSDYTRLNDDALHSWTLNEDGGLARVATATLATVALAILAAFTCLKKLT